MKTNFILFLITCLCLEACQDSLLNIPSQTSLTSDTFFKTAADFQQAINANYAPLRVLYNPTAGNATAVGDMHSDNAYYVVNPGYRAQVDLEDIANFLVQPANVVTTQKYINNYLIIARSNQILSSIDDVQFDEAVKSNIKGQALFLRALAYFDLVQYYGKVPLHLQPATSREDAALPLSTETDVYAQIIKDATQAASLLPVKSKQEASRATQGAVQTLLGNVYIVQKQWANAEIVLKSVVNSSEYSLWPNYADAFTSASENGRESVFEVQYLEGTQGFASNFLYQFLPMPITASQVAGLTGAANAQALTTEGMNIPTPDLIAAYESGDKRLAASINNIDVGTRSIPYAKKFVQPHAQFNITGINWPVYRYAETLLLLAEALNENGKSVEALPFLNQVRQRAGLTASSTSAQTDLRTAIQRERRVELALEGKRWTDLVRTGNAVAVMTAFGAKVKASPTTYYFSSGLVPAPSAFTKIDLTYPLPSSESLLSPYF